jgi:hypothetical protein
VRVHGKFGGEEGVELGDGKATEEGVGEVVPKTRDTGV